ncbi:MAG: sensor domain-containing diguanylate cyclase [Actinomycetota bacterium]|nr:sensor domain-containing diguanylate cyclase [Actinomycetota bacterium]
MVALENEDNKHQLSLKGRLSILLIVMLLPFVCFSIYQAVEISNHLESEAQQENLRIAKNVAISLDEYITSTGEVLIPIANNESVRDQDYPKTKELLERILLKYPYYNSLSFVDANGIKQVMAKREDTSESKPMDESDNSVRELPFFKRGIEASGISVGDFKFCGVTNMPIVHITYPVFDPSEKRVGLVAAAFNLTKLQDKLMSPEIPDYVTVCVIDNNGIMVARNREPKKFIGKDLSKETIFKNMLGLKQGIDKARTPDGVERAFGFERASRVPWYVRAGVDTEYIKGQARTEFMHQFLVFVPFLLLSVLGWFWVGKGVDRVHSSTGQLSLTDPLTGLWNLRKLQQDLDYEFSRAKRYNNKLSFAMIDIDFFKYYNDHNGHQAGDEALRQVSDLIRKSVRDADIAYRYGGEEMCVLLSTTDKEGAAYLAERIRRGIEAFSFAGGEKQPNGKLTVSIGVATYPDDSSFRDGLVNSADIALYRAKHLGRNRVDVYGGTMPAHKPHDSFALPSTNAEAFPASDSDTDTKTGSDSEPAGQASAILRNCSR